jgi:hypothetical protein
MAQKNEVSQSMKPCRKQFEDEADFDRVEGISNGK